MTGLQTASVGEDQHFYTCLYFTKFVRVVPALSLQDTELRQYLLIQGWHSLY